MEITLALGGGGTRGAAHVGVLRVLEREGFRIRGVAGTSAGSMIAGLYAAGYTTDKIQTALEEVDFTNIYGSLLSDGAGLLGVSGIEQWIQRHLGGLTFAQLKIPLAIIAVDLISRSEVVFREGLVADAIRGSIAVPGIFPPLELENMRLIDGGTLDPIPVRAARAFAPKLPVAAVALISPVDDRGVSLPSPLRVPAPIVQHLTRLRITQAFGVFLESIDIAQRSMTALRLEVDKPDILILPDVRGLSFLDKVDITDVVRRGEDATQASLPALQYATSWQGRLSRTLGLRFPK